jgi:uncharacterized protein YbbC (DUF1343 family)
METRNSKLETGNPEREPANLCFPISVFLFLSVFICVHLWLLPCASAQPAKKSSDTRAPAKSTAPSLSGIDAVIEKAIADDEFPGAVVLVGQRGKIILEKAYGSRAVLPAMEAMTTDTIFDMASLTKVVATTSSVMKLVEAGRIRLNDPLVRYIPEFASKENPGGKDQVTIRHLMTHTAGLRPIPPITGAWSGTEPVLQSIYGDPLAAPPGARFVYSDSGFILLGEVVRRVSGLPLSEFAAQNIFTPMGMKTTRFLPPAEWKSRIAPTEEIDLPEKEKAGSGKGRVLRGEVHDPRARGMGGVAGHAGLFSTANDLSLFCRMLLNGGVAPNGARILAAATIEKMSAPQTPPWVPSQRGLGWDIDSTFSAPRGEFFPLGSFGHTGFTGTSIWMDPQSGTFVIILSSTQHPYPRPAISSLRSRVATLVARAILPSLPASTVGSSSFTSSTSFRASTSTLERSLNSARTAPRNAQTKTGIDVLAEQKFASLRGKRVGLITNHTGIDRAGRSTIDLLAKAEDVKLVALFSPEHGIAGRMDEKVASSVDAATGLPIHSLYGETRRPSAEMLNGIDVLVFDIQDAGIRFYTYTTTLGYCMEEAAKNKIPIVVLDRPNPLGGLAIEGPMLDQDRLNFVGYFPMPIRYAMTIGELAQMFNAENKIGADLTVIKMQDWQRRDIFEATGLLWTAPSPNLRSLDATVLYAGIEILQSGGISVGRGTDTPFELFGAPWIKGVELAEYLNKRFVPGVKFVPTRFTPTSGLHKDVLCEGAALVITDRQSVHSVLMGLEIAEALQKLYPGKFNIDKIITLLGNKATLERVKKGDAPTRIVAEWEDELAAFGAMRAKYLLYR